jgi:DTW domain-containing protein YfiP
VSRRNNAASRCERCRMHSSLCVCALIPTLQTRTRLLLVIHRAEDRKPTNTGRLAACAMPNSEIIIRGRAEERADSIVLDPRARPLFLFPHEDAVPLESVMHAPGDDRPFTLIVPDGNWRQASKVRNRVPGMRDVPCVSLPVGAPSTYRLRSEAHPFGLATLEAIGRCLRVLEGDAGPEVERALLHVFRAMVERTLWSRGELRTHEVAAGIPEGALRHDPRSGDA